MVIVPGVMTMYAGVPANTLKEVIALAKAKPNSFNYGSPGPLTSGHLSMEMLKVTAGISITHIPYKGGAPAIADLIAGQIQFLISGPPGVLPHIKSGRLKAIATTMPTRLSELPNVATMAEQGFPGIGTNAWQALFAPAATPKPIVDKLYAAVVAVLSRPEMKEMLARQLMTVALSSSPQEFTDQVRAETQAWSEFVRDNKVKIE